DARGKVIADGRRVHDRVQLGAFDLLRERGPELFKSTISADVPFFADGRRPRCEVADDLRVRREQADRVAVLPGLQRDPRAGPAAEDVGQTAHAVDRGLRVAGRDEDTHGSLPGRDGYIVPQK